MKKLSAILLIILSMGFYSRNSFAQNTALMTATLTNVLTMVVSSAPVFAFATASDYQNGINATGAGTILVSSNFDYDISVASAGSNLVEQISSNIIPVADFTIDASGDGGLSVSAKALSTSSQKIVDEGAAGVANIINLSYYASGGADFLNKVAGSYLQTLTFTASVD